MSKKRTHESNKKSTYGKLFGWVAVVIALAAGSVLLVQRVAIAADVVVYKSPTCGCCNKWVSHLKENGFTVEVHDRRDMSPVKSQFGVPRHLQSCHTAEVEGYVVEGHVPADVIMQLLAEKPQVKGLAVPGMPMGSPGMEGPRKDPYKVLTIQEQGRSTVYANR